MDCILDVQTEVLVQINTKLLGCINEERNEKQIYWWDVLPVSHWTISLKRALKTSQSRVLSLHAGLHHC